MLDCLGASGCLSLLRPVVADLVSAAHKAAPAAQCTDLCDGLSSDRAKTVCNKLCSAVGTSKLIAALREQDTVPANVCQQIGLCKNNTCTPGLEHGKPVLCLDIKSFELQPQGGPPCAWSQPCEVPLGKALEVVCTFRAVHDTGVGLTRLAFTDPGVPTVNGIVDVPNNGYDASSEHVAKFVINTSDATYGKWAPGQFQAMVSLCSLECDESARAHTYEFIYRPFNVTRPVSGAVALPAGSDATRGSDGTRARRDGKSLDGKGALVWSDEFEGRALNATWWNVADGMDHGLNELQLYTPENVAVANGTLVISTRRDPGRIQNSTGRAFNFSSAWVSTGYGVGASAKFLRAGGRWEVRAKLPPIGCPGAWPAHWLMPRAPCWPVGGEIDIMEMWGKRQRGLDKKVTVSSTYHYGEACNQNKVSKKNRRYGHYPQLPWAEKQIRWDLEYHTFAVEWQVNRSLSFYVDGHHMLTLTDKDVDFIPFEPMAVILNTALDADQFQDEGESLCAFPIRHFIDYVRVYELPDDPTSDTDE